jgi:NAD(P)-dependent dehydrogenase (short-subunit alcohol dehydrogenase family)
VSKVLLVTGGSRGIGAATALMASERGYAVAVNYTTDKVRAEGVAAQIKNSFIIQADVSKPEDVARMFNEIEKHLGAVTHVVNSAGVTGKSSSLAQASIDIISATIDVNLLGTIYVAREAAQRLKRGGAIVNVSSGAASLGSPHEFVWYAASKAGVDALTLGLGRELAEQGIRVCGIAPGLTETEMHALSTGDAGRIERMGPSIPMKRAAKPEEIAETILFLLSDAASYITATTLRVAGGR